MTRRFLTSLGLAALLAGCATAPPEPPTPAGPPPPTDAEIVEAVRAAGIDGAELVVRPFIDPHAKDLRLAAAAAEAAGRLDEAEARLYEALGVTPDDPDLLQWRAEIALLRGEHAAAEALAKRSIALGPKSGPLCRRNWTLLGFLREGRGEVENARSARAMVERCTIAPPVRM
jgi:tetratricopeptide (TPR) repeat protein